MMGELVRFARLLIASVVVMGFTGGGVNPALAADSRPIIRTRLAPAQVTVGQTVTLSVDVLVPSWFTAPIDFPASVDLPGVTALLSHSGGSNLSERIDGVSYAGMTRDYQLIAHHAGSYTVPPLALQVSYSVAGQPRSVTLQTTPRHFSASLPRGSENLGYFIATHAYSLKQSVNRPLAGLKVGDAITRRFIQRAAGVASMTLPALEFASIDGLGTYPAEPQLSDSGGERGSARIGERREEVSYLLREPGRYELPGLKIGWFDPDANQMRWSSVPPLRFDVGANAASAPRVRRDGVPPAPTVSFQQRAATFLKWVQPWGGLLTASVLLGILLHRRWPSWCQRRQAEQVRRQNSEAAAFRHCCKTLRNATPAQALGSTMTWLRHVPRSPGSEPLARFASRHGDEALRNQLIGLHCRLFSPAAAGDWNPATFTRSLAAARQRWLYQRKVLAPAGNTLPPLNPGNC